jgi:hypothetical protein
MNRCSQLLYVLSDADTISVKWKPNPNYVANIKEPFQSRAGCPFYRVTEHGTWHGMSPRWNCLAEGHCVSWAIHSRWNYEGALCWVITLQHKLGLQTAPQRTFRCYYIACLQLTWQALAPVHRQTMLDVEVWSDSAEQSLRTWPVLS